MGSILRCVEKFNSCGNVENRTGRERLPNTEQAIKHVQYYFRRHPRRFPRHPERDLSIPFSIVCKILRSLIQMFPYKVTRIRHLLDCDKIERVIFATCYNVEMSIYWNFLRPIVFSDDISFTHRDLQILRMFVLCGQTIYELFRSMKCTVQIWQIGPVFTLSGC